MGVLSLANLCYFDFMKEEFILENTSQLKDLAENIIVKALALKSSKATVFKLEGNLGAGKTTLVKEIGKLLFTNTMITSPTFVIMKTHKIQNPKIPYVNLVHIDAYRLTPKDAQILRLPEIMSNNDNLVFVEWPENVIDADLSGAVTINIEHLGDTKRKVIINP